jgi:hypothetical protein
MKQIRIVQSKADRRILAAVSGLHGVKLTVSGYSGEYGAGSPFRYATHLWDDLETGREAEAEIALKNVFGKDAHL